jgi:hypothetical protein
MKKIILLLLIGYSSFSQNEESSKPDVVNRMLLDYYKKQEVSSPEARDVILKFTNKIIETTKDTALISLCKKHVVNLNNAKFPFYSNANLTKASKEDLKKFEVTFDKFTETTTIRNKKKWPSPLYLSLKVKKDKQILILRSMYRGSDWLFINSIDLLIDNKKYSYELDDDVLREVISGQKVHESATNYVDDNIHLILENIFKSSSDVEMRFNGKNYHEDEKLTKYNIELMKDIFDLYQKIKE